MEDFNPLAALQDAISFYQHELQSTTIPSDGGRRLSNPLNLNRLHAAAANLLNVCRAARTWINQNRRYQVETGSPDVKCYRGFTTAGAAQLWSAVDDAERAVYQDSASWDEQSFINADRLTLLNVADRQLAGILTAEQHAALDGGEGAPPHIRNIDDCDSPGLLGEWIEARRKILAHYIQHKKSVAFLGEPSQYWSDQTWRAYHAADRLKINHGNVAPADPLMPRQVDELLAKLLVTIKAGETPQNSEDMSAGADDLDPALAKNDRTTLCVLAEFNTGVLATLEEISDKMDDYLGGIKQRTFGACIKKLIDLKLAERPSGERGGTRLTTKGRLLANAMPRLTPI